MFLANKLVEQQVKSFITYNKGQTWALLPAPNTDVAGNNLHCVLVSGFCCSGRTNTSCFQLISESLMCDFPIEHGNQRF